MALLQVFLKNKFLIEIEILKVYLVQVSKHSLMLLAILYVFVIQIFLL